MTSNEIAVAEKLMQVNAIQLNADKPFTWTSGWKSPIYCDTRKVLGFPYIRDFIKSELSSIIFERFAQAEVIAGVATAGIAWGAMAADQLKLPFVYVRPSPKEHGMGNQIEGFISPGQKVLVIEDLVSTGISSLKVCEVLKLAGVEVLGLVSIFNYGFPQAAEAFAKVSIPFVSLTNYDVLIKMAVEKGIVSHDQQNGLLNWRNNPSGWQG